MLLVNELIKRSKKSLTTKYATVIMFEIFVYFLNELSLSRSFESNKTTFNKCIQLHGSQNNLKTERRKTYASLTLRENSQKR